MRILVRKDELEKAKKMFMAIGKDTEKIERKASEKGITLKSGKALKDEAKAELDKPEKPKGKD